MPSKTAVLNSFALIFNSCPVRKTTGRAGMAVFLPAAFDHRVGRAIISS